MKHEPIHCAPVLVGEASPEIFIPSVESKAIAKFVFKEQHRLVFVDNRMALITKKRTKP